MIYKDDRRVKKYSLEAMTKGSDARYLGDTLKLKVAQGVVGAVADKGSVLRFLPYTMQAVKQGFQDLGVTSIPSAHQLLHSEELRLEIRTGAAQVEGAAHGLVSYEKKFFDASAFYLIIYLVSSLRCHQIFNKNLSCFSFIFCGLCCGSRAV